MKAEIIMKAIEEINNPMFKLTKQYLKVNELIYKNNEPEIEEIVIDEMKSSILKFILI